MTGIMLAQTTKSSFRRENIHIQCCPNLPEPTLHKKITCAMLKESTNNFAPKNNQQFFPDLSGPTLHKEITSSPMAKRQLS